MKDFRARRWQQEDRNPMMTVFEKAGRYPDIIDLSIGDPDLKTPQKIIDRQPGEHAGGAAGGQHVTRPGHKVARAFGRPGSDKNRAGRAHFFHPAAR